MPELKHPIKGLAKGISSHLLSDEYSEYMDNVRPFDVLESKARIGQRPGLDKWGNGDQIGGADQPVVAITSVTTVV